MRILQIAPYFLPYLGGQERYVYYLSRELVRKGHEVTVVTANYPQGAEREEIDGIQIHRHRCLARPLRNPIAPGMLQAGKLAKQFDLIHAHNEHSSAANIAAWIKHRCKCPLVITSHGELVFGSKSADLFRNLYWNTLGKMTLKSADRITVATPSEKNRLVDQLKLNPDTIDLLPVGIDLEYWDSQLTANSDTFKRTHQLSGRKILLVATQLIKRKGVGYLLEAMPAIIQAHPDALLAIAGSGDEEQNLNQQTVTLGLTHHTRFLGQLNDQQLAQAYQSADLFILPSLSEGQPTCVMEAWAFSRPVVATRITGVVDYFDKTAMLAEPKNPASLAASIITLLSNPELAQNLGARGRKLVESRFCWNQLIDQAITTYQSTLHPT